MENGLLHILNASYNMVVDSLKVYDKHYLGSWQWHKCEATENNMM